MLIILTDQIVTSIRLPGFSEVFNFRWWKRWHENVTKRLSLSSEYCTPFETRYLIGRNNDAVCKYKVHIKFSNGELSDPLCVSVNRGLTLVRLKPDLLKTWTVSTRRIKCEIFLVKFWFFSLNKKVHTLSSRFLILLNK